MSYFRLKTGKSYSIKGYKFLPDRWTWVKDKDDYVIFETGVVAKQKYPEEKIIDKIIQPLHIKQKTKSIGKKVFIDDIISTSKTIRELKIGVMRLGGIGDTIHLACLCGMIKERWGDCYITAFAKTESEKNYIEAYYPYINEVKAIGANSWSAKIAENLAGEFDIFYDLGFVVKVFQKKEYLTKKEMENVNKWGEYFLTHTDKFILDPVAKAISIPLNLEYMRPLLNNLQWQKTAEILKNSKYICIHLAKGVLRNTKTFPTALWQEVTNYLLENTNYKVIQLGEWGEDKIEGTIDLRGKTDVRELVWILKEAEFLIDSDSGLAHIAKSLRVPSIVLWGATSPKVWGYKENVNLRTDKCPSCWSAKAVWYDKCVKSNGRCLRDITAEMVIAEIKNLKTNTERKGYLVAAYSVLNEKEYIRESILSIYDAVDKIIILRGTKGWSHKVELDNTVELIKSLPDKQKKIIIIQKDWSIYKDKLSGEQSQRTEGFDFVKENGWYWLIDGDEIYRKEDALKFREILKNEKRDMLAIQHKVFWQDLYTIAYYEWFWRFSRKKGELFYRSDNCPMRLDNGNYEAGKIKGIYCYHYAYNKNDENIKNKVDLFRNRHKELKGMFYDNWWEKVWKGYRRGEKIDHIHLLKNYPCKTILEQEKILPEVLKNHIYNWQPGLLSAITVSYNSEKALRQLAASIGDLSRFEWIIIDNASKDREYLKTLEKQGAKVIYLTANAQFTAALNIGIEYSRGEYLLSLNPDVIFRQKNWVELLIKRYNITKAGIWGCKQVDSRGVINFAGGIISKEKRGTHIGRGEKDNGQYNEVTETDYITGSCFLFHRKIMIACGLLDENFPHYESDNRYCIKAKQAGFSVKYDGTFKIVHNLGTSCAKDRK